MDSISSLLDSWLISATSGSPFVSLGIFAVAGLLSSLFPCYYPLIPVTAGFLRRRGQGGPEPSPVWLHPLIYWAGSVALYLLAGIVAAFGGRALSQIMQNGWVILFLGIAFLYLTLAMLDVVSIGLDRARSLVDRAGSHSGLTFTFAMGMAAGLAASACVSPALVTILLFIARTGSSGAGLLSGGAMAVAYGAGLGLPLFLAGVLGSKLPASGRWMSPVKYAFAGVIYLAAFFQIEKAFIVLGVPAGHTRMFLLYFTAFGALLIFGLPLILRRPIEQGRIDIIRFRRVQAAAVFVLFTLFALPFLVNRRPASIDDGSLRGRTEAVGPLTFYRNPAEAFEKARQTGRPIFIDFYADWCTNCKDFSHLIETDAELSNGLNRAVLLKVYDVDPAFEDFAKRFEELNVGLPFFAVLNSDGSLRFKTSNYRDRQGMIRATAP